jgi:transcription elongation factor GreA
MVRDIATNSNKGEAWMAESRLITAEGVEQLRAELHRLETEERAKVVAQIKTAREWGDLKENSEYHAAKDAQSHLETRILRLREKLLNAEVVEAGVASDGTARLGATVTYEDERGGQVQSVRLVASHEANPSAGALSVESPIGAALNGRRVGDVAEVTTPKRVRRLRITAVS